MFQQQKAIEKSRLGELLVSKGLVTRYQLEQALAAQRESGMKLGEVLIGWGWISERQLNRALTRQKSYRYAIAFAAAVSAPLTPVISFASTNNNQTTAEVSAPATDQHVHHGMPGSLAAMDDDDLQTVSGQGLAVGASKAIPDIGKELASMLGGTAGSTHESAGSDGSNASVPSNLPVGISTSGGGLGTLTSLAQVLLPLDADVKISWVAYASNQTPAKINQDGSMEFQLPASVDSIEFNNIRPKGTQTGSMGDMALVGVKFNNVTMKISIRS